MKNANKKSDFAFGKNDNKQPDKKVSGKKPGAPMPSVNKKPADNKAQAGKKKSCK